ncbi:hypothetical protein ACWD6I_15080 [Streptomyces sp. NPDC002454]|uniref:hypothetical protein n=1 Tax=unclassified Streptomyces TaxID=2593676 RepID=UPI003332726A
MPEPRPSDAPRRAPYRTVLAFLLLLGAVFSAGRAIGSAVDPVGPSVHPARTGTDRPSPVEGTDPGAEHPPGHPAPHTGH